MNITIKDRLTQYIIYIGFVSVNYYKELINDKDFIVTINSL